MKIRVLDRILVCIAGLVLICLCGCLIAQVLFGVPVSTIVTDYINGLTDGVRVAVISVSLVLLAAIGLYCFLLLFRRRAGKRGFVTQETDNGDVHIAIKAMETMVAKCVEHHPEMKLTHVNIDPIKGGVDVFVKISLASGVSIPLAVGALQREATQYLTACSGVDVRDVCVQVETNSNTAPNCPYLVPELLLPRETAAEEPRDERPAHQRIFGREQEPVTGPEPAPVQPEVPTEEKPAEEKPAEEKPVEETPEVPEEAPAEEPADETPAVDETIDEKITAAAEGMSATALEDLISQAGHTASEPEE